MKWILILVLLLTACTAGGEAQADLGTRVQIALEQFFTNLNAGKYAAAVELSE